MKLRLLVLPLLLAVSACDTKKSMVNAHDRNSEEVIVRKPKETDHNHIPSLDALKLRNLAAGPRTNSATIYQSILKPIEKSLINVRSLSNPDIFEGDFTVWMDVYTEALFVAMKKNPTRDVRRSFDNFIELTFRHCNTDLQGCSFQHYFKVSKGSSQLLVLKSIEIGKKIDACEERNGDCSDLITEKYRLLAHANGLKRSKLADKDYVESYLDHAHLIKKIKTVSIYKKYSSNFLNTLIPFLNTNGEDQDYSCSIVRKYDVWKYSSINSASSQISMDTLFEFATKCNLYDDKKQLTDSFKKSLFDIQLKSKSTTNLSFYQKALKASKSKEDRKMFSQYGLSNSLNLAKTLTEEGTLDTNIYNEYFYAMDRFFNGHISREEASRVLRASDRSYSEMLKTWEMYTKFQMLLAVRSTKEYLMNTVFNTEAVISSEDLFEKSIDDSEGITRRWQEVVAKLGQLKDLVKPIVQSHGNRALRRKYDKINSRYNNISKSIAYMATYPSMFMLAHLLAEKNGTVKFKTWWGAEIELDANSVYSKLLKGNDSPWFIFSDVNPLDKFELLYAFDYTLKLGFSTLPDTLSTERKKAPKNEVVANFIKILISKHLSEAYTDTKRLYDDEYVKKVDNLKVKAESDTWCRYELDVKHKTVPSVSMNMMTLSSHIHSGQGGERGYATPINNFFVKGSVMLRHINDLLGPKLRRAKLLMKIANRNHPGVDFSKAEEVIALADNLISKVVNDIAKKQKERSKCMARLILVESYYQYLAYKSESAYLGKVWEDLNSIQGLEGDALSQRVLEINNIPERYRDRRDKSAPLPVGNMPTAKAFVDRIVKESGVSVKKVNFDELVGKTSFSYSKLDFIVRLKNNLESGDINSYQDGEIESLIKAWRTKFPGVFTKSIDIPRKWNLRVPPNLRDLGITKVISNIPWMDNKENFIKAGMKSLKGDQDSFVRWYDYNNTTLGFQEILKLRVNLFLSIYQPDKNSLRLSAKDLLKSMESILNFVDMKGYDAWLAEAFGYQSKIFINKLSGVLFDNSTKEASYPFSYLYDIFKESAGMTSDIFKSNFLATSFTPPPLLDSYKVSRILNDDLFILYFDNHEWIDSILVNSYKDFGKNYLSKIEQLSYALQSGKTNKYARIIYKMEESGGKTLEESSLDNLSNNLVNPSKITDMSDFINQYFGATENAFKLNKKCIGCPDGI